MLLTKPAWTLLGLALSMSGTALSAQAQDDTFTQIGTWSCYYPSFEGSGDFVCPPISFPKTFGDKPDLIIPSIQGTANYAGFKEVVDIKAASFTPVLYRSSGRGSRIGGTITGTYVAVGPRPAVPISIKPKYVILALIYAPPGTAGGKGASVVEYSSGSSAGTTTSISKSFKSNIEVSFSGEGGFLGNGGGAGVSFGYGTSTTDSASTDLKRGTNTSLKDTGPSMDGIDHDQDLVYLWLNPELNVKLASASAAWSFSGNATADIQYVYMGWLKNPSLMPPGVAQSLAAKGFTPDDYAQILKQDPLLVSGSSPDPARYTPINSTIPYEPPYSAGGAVPTTTYSISNTSSSTLGSSASETYQVKFDIFAQGNYLDFVKAKLQNTDTFEWTNTSSHSTTSGVSETASLTMGGPAFGYQGQTHMKVYFDTIYRTFAFVSAPNEPLALTGSVVDARGKPLPGTEVVVSANGVANHVWTNTKGVYRIYGVLLGPLVIKSPHNTANFSPTRSNKTAPALVEAN